MSVFKYNNIFIQFAKTKVVRAEMEYDPSGTDALFTRYTIEVQGVLSTSQGTLPTHSPATLADIKHRLEIPRSDLLYQVGPTTIFDIRAPDAKLGPKPRPCEIRQVHEGVFLVDWGADFWVAGCEEEDGGKPVLSNRWTLTEDRDEDWLTVLKIQGRLIIRTDMGETSADAFRKVVVPDVQQRFVRTHTFTLSPDGRELEYVITDRERYMLPPAQLIRADGDFAMLTNLPGAKRLAMVHVDAVGPPNNDRRSTIAAAVRVAWAKILASGPQKAPDGVVPMGFEIREGLWQNSASVRATAILADTKTPMVAASINAGFGTTPGSKHKSPGIAPPIRGQLAVLFPAAYRDPCTRAAVRRHGDKSDSDAGTPDIIEEADGTTIGQGPLSPDVESPGYQSSRDAGGYDYYNVTCRYEGNTGKIQLPATGVGADGGKSTTVQFGGGELRLKVYWAAKRRGKPPMLPEPFPDTGSQSDSPGGSPSPTRAGGNFELLSFNADVDELDLSADAASPVYSMAGTYTYAVLNPTICTLRAAVPPFLSDVIAAAADYAAGSTDSRVLWRDATTSPTKFLFDPDRPPPARSQPRLALPPGTDLAALARQMALADAAELNRQQPTAGRPNAMFSGGNRVNP